MKTAIVLLFATLFGTASFAQQKFQPVPVDQIGPQYDGIKVMRRVVWPYTPYQPFNDDASSSYIIVIPNDTTMDVIQKKDFPALPAKETKK